MVDPVPGGRGAEKPRCFLWEAAAAAVRVVGTPDQPFFVGKDVCTALGYTKYRDALALLDDDERGSSLVDTLGGAQEMVCVTESGLYALIFGSRKEQARIFRKWVTSEVLPAIRKTGGYAVPAPLPALPELAPCKIEIQHRITPPPAPPSEQELVCNLIAETLGLRRQEATVHSRTLFDLAVRADLLSEWIGHHPREWQRRARFMRRLQGYMGRWLACEQPTLFFWVGPSGHGRARRYYLAEKRISAPPVADCITPAPEALAIVTRALTGGEEVLVK